MLAKKKLAIVEEPKDLKSRIEFLLSISKPVAEMGRELRSLEHEFGAEAYSLLFMKLFNLEVTSGEARKHWMEIEAHHRAFVAEIGDEVDVRVSALDYLLRIAKLIKNPAILESKKIERILADTMTDELTGLYNYRHFRQTLEREMARVSRYQDRLALLFFDVDYFKNLNDEKGHLAGDEVLRKVANILVDSVRSSDFPCRYAGEEFAIIVPQVTREGALLLAERIRKKVQEKTAVTISGGVACFPEDARSADELLEKADQALYRSKHKGRNQVSAHEGERRRTERLPVELSGVYSVLPKRRELLSTLNISQKGFLIETTQPLPPESVVSFELALSAQESVHCTGRVAFVRDTDEKKSFEVGVSILQMSAQDEQKYHSFILTSEKK